jgi:hypothetical protein
MVIEVKSLIKQVATLVAGTVTISDPNVTSSRYRFQLKQQEEQLVHYYKILLLRAAFITHQ